MSTPASPSTTPPRRRRRWLPWVIGGVVVVVLVAVVAPYVYIHFIEGPAPKELELKADSVSLCPDGTRAKGATSATVAVAGTWKPASCSVVRYRVKEVLFGQSTTAVGSTNAVTGNVTIKGTTVETATFTADMSQVHSDKSQRDGQFQGRIMDVAQYPTATFALTSPVDLAPVPAAGKVATYQAKGNFTAHGTTRAVTITLHAQRRGNRIAVQGQIPITFADYTIPNPSFGPASTEDNGIVEFQLVLLPADA